MALRFLSRARLELLVEYLGRGALQLHSPRIDYSLGHTRIGLLEQDKHDGHMAAGTRGAGASTSYFVSVSERFVPQSERNFVGAHAFGGR